ncbi:MULTISPECIES: AMIN-like domain-containing (lipo)protein [Streptomyces]|uniref:AMIN-like domain-containing protein n=1 Tax=Streptomyces ehimensis TaxID=68195 RepID=A0ABV9BG10_9ACTN
MGRLRTGLVAFLLVGAGMTMAVAPGGTAVAAGSGKAATPPAAGCAAVDWGSLPKDSAVAWHKPLRDIRTGGHDCYDRVVLDLLGPGTGRPIGFHVRYVDQFQQDGSGDVIPVRGGAILEVRVAAPSYDPATMQRTYDGKAGQPLPEVDLGGYRTFQDTRFGASFEGDTQIAVGVRERLPFRVFQTGNHLVVDVAHSWRGFR